MWTGTSSRSCFAWSRSWSRCQKRPFQIISLVGFYIRTRTTTRTDSCRLPWSYYRQCCRVRGIFKDPAPLRYDEICERFQTPNIRRLQYAHWDTLPTNEDILFGGMFVAFVRSQNYKNTGILSDALLPDLWEMVCSFLIGYADYIILSVPLSLLRDLPEPKDYDEKRVICSGWLNRHNIHRFLGPETGEPFLIETGRQSKAVRVQGACPFNTREICDDISVIYRNPGEPFESCTRFLVGIRPELSQIWNAEFVSASTSWRTWRKNMSDAQSFGSFKDARAATSYEPKIQYVFSNPDNDFLYWSTNGTGEEIEDDEEA